MTKKCYKGGEKHNFKPRYEEKPINRFFLEKTKGCTPDQFRTFLFYNAYVCDICVWCGKVISR